MTKISSYIIDQNIVGNDKWIGSDAQNNLRTKNFTPNNLADYFNGNNVIDIGTSIRYRYQTLDIGEDREQGTISFETEIGPQVNFSDITTFLIAKNTLKGNTVTEYLDFLVDGKVILSKSSNINTFGYYKVTSIEPWIVDPNFFVVVVEFLEGNGFIYEDLDYLVSLVDKGADFIPTAWGSITGDINDQTDLIDYLDNGFYPLLTNPAGYLTLATLPPVVIPTLQDVVEEGRTFTETGIANTYDLEIFSGTDSVIAFKRFYLRIRNLAGTIESIFNYTRNLFNVKVSNSATVNAEINITGSGLAELKNSNASGTSSLGLTPRGTSGNISIRPNSSLKEGTYDLGLSRIAVSGNITADINVDYFISNVGLPIFTDPTPPFSGNRNTYTVYCALGGAVIGGVTYGIGDLIYRTYNVSTLSWTSTNMNANTLQDLQSVLNEGNTATDSTIELYNSSSDVSNFINNAEMSIDNSITNDYSYLSINSLTLHNEALSSTISIQHDKIYRIKGSFHSSLLFTNPTANRSITFKDESGTVALTSDIPSLTGYVPYTGATADVNLGEFGLLTGNIEFDNTPTNIPTAAGSMYWNDSDGTTNLILKGGNVTLQVGQEQVIRVVNKTATNVDLLESNYQAVRVTGAQGQRLKVDLAQATNDLLSAETIGLVTETINNNQEGFITTSGLVRNINTTGSIQGETWADGDILYLSPTTPGMATKVKPVAPDHLVILGYVVHAHITQGSIFVKVDNGYELDELHNVKITSPQGGQSLIYNSSLQIWENKIILDYTNNFLLMGG